MPLVHGFQRLSGDARGVAPIRIRVIGMLDGLVRCFTETDRSTLMNKGTIALTSVGIGVGLMYLLDPQGGKRRRARARDAAVHGAHVVKNAAGAASRDLEHRVGGLAARTQALLSTQPAPSDDVLAERVRARIGRLVSHPRAIEVKADDGAITLSGPVFEAETARLVHGVRAVPGVTRVEDRLERHATAGNVSALQGRGAAHAGGWHWTPATRVMAGAAGLALMAVTARRRTIRGTAVGLAGFELFEQALRGHRSGSSVKQVSNASSERASRND